MSNEKNGFENDDEDDRKSLSEESNEFYRMKSCPVQKLAKVYKETPDQSEGLSNLEGSQGMHTDNSNSNSPGLRGTKLGHKGIQSSQKSWKHSQGQENEFRHTGGNNDVGDNIHDLLDTVEEQATENQTHQVPPIIKLNQVQFM